MPEEITNLKLLAYLLALNLGVLLPICLVIWFFFEIPKEVIFAAVPIADIVFLTSLLLVLGITKQESDRGDG